MLASETWLTVGKLVAPQGMQGELRINPASDFPERFTKPGQRWLQANNEKPHEIDLLKGRKLPGKSIFVVRFAGINSRTAAEALVGQKMLVPSSSRPKLAEGEFHLLDLLGLEARLDEKGPAIGKVTDLTKAGNDLIEIQLLNGRKVLVPLVLAIVPRVELNEGWIKLTPPPGLLEL